MSRLPTSVCAPFDEAAMLALDREMGPAERAALEAHLATCGRCRRRVADARGLASLLRSWDNERVQAVEPPARLRTAIRAAAEEIAVPRRREVRHLRLVRVAVAASVVLVLGLAGLLGLLGGPAGAGQERVSAALAPAPAAEIDPRVASDLPAPLRPAGRVAVAVGPSPLLDLPPSAGHANLRPLTEDERPVAVRALRDLQRRRIAEAAFAARAGEPGVWWSDPIRGGAERLLSVSAARKADQLLVDLHRRGVAAADVTRPAPRVYADTSTWVDTGLRLGDLVGLPADPRALGRWLGAQRFDGGPGLGLHLIARDGTHAPVGSGRTVASLREAVAAGEIRLVDGTEDDLVAIVRPGARSTLVPVGALIGGGVVDRVVARSTWLHADPATEQRYVIVCHAVASRNASRPGEPTPTGMIAGPALRRLLVRGAPASDVAALVDRQMRAVGAVGLDFSLLQVYDVPALREATRPWALMLDRAGIRGLVLTGPGGALEGVEISDLPGPAAAELLATLLMGYQVERALASGQPPDGPPAGEVLARLLAYPGTLRAPKASPGAARVARLVEPASHAAFEVVEKDGRVVLLSGLVP